ncbi:enoyl-CoA hydratase/isomerase family protein [Alkalihalobacterium chitinilyticum]|uniref:Enoyl-CoA hydratase-related protein n=1 Tax=Alkalihalobacterium chitinilyticum TaxID=2980103 RepID=A0ABT5VJT4_9BACI|nr:enoyl-CoA hydratase-related protein [Alkalihalobacterium chitinilyticum]MDE5415674.1 enoyl-CoA hydratase-related protein [Alkalihalobacterium chitinilyticum]
MAKVKYEVENQIGTITIDSPPVNALEKQVLEELSVIVNDIAEDVNVVIITGAGNKAFVAGADIKDFPTLTAETGVELVKKGQQIFQQIADLEQPVIAAIDGFALGGGLELALACDFRIATSRSQFGLPEVKLGILPGYGGTQRLPRLIGSGKAKQLIFSGEFLSAEEAYKVGIVEEVTENSALDEARKWAEKISKRGPLAVRAAKKAVNEGLDQSVEEGLHTEATYFGTLCETEDKNEGVAAFFEKREPNFTRK